MFFLFKIILSGCIIALASRLASKDSALAGFLVALPLVSMLSILFAYWETHDMGKVNQFAGSILLAVPLSLTFFVPFLLNRWLKMNFFSTYILGLACLTIAYVAHRFIFKGFSN
ncbi:MAG: hypothetical protein WC133_03540 [Candidatus Omnitrophota bacterium]